MEPLEGRILMIGSVVINEIHHEPDVKNVPLEFIELHNPGDAAVSLTGAAFTEGVTYAFPAGTSLPAGGYLVVAENPAAFQNKFGTTALGPYAGELKNSGEKLVISSSAGTTLDTVDYGAGFPWPTVGDAPGRSIELINPALDNDLGGNWRSIPASSTGVGSDTLFSAGGSWRYLKGTAEASTPDKTSWRQRTFGGDVSWPTGAGPVGYDPNVPMGTRLDDMQGNYASVFLRKTFEVSDPAAYANLRLAAQYDDGFNAWINGVLVVSTGMPSTNPNYNGLASSSGREDNAFANFDFTLPAGTLVAGTNVIAVQFHNGSLAASSDAFFDASLTRRAGVVAGGPTPGARNSAFSANAPPAMRQVKHGPEAPAAGQPVTITTKVTDPNGVASVQLQYQVVDPGAYINYSDPAYATTWTNVPMADNGTAGDAVGGDGVYTVVLPGSLQVHRRLVRYRIASADTLGAGIVGPYGDDAQLNFAYFVSNGNPAWTASAQPGVAPAVTYGADVMNSIPSFTLISKKADAEGATWYSQYGGDDYLWTGTVVYNGKVYDNVAYRARGGVWRYAMGKNSWKFNFRDNHSVGMLDNFGAPFGDWDKVNLRPLIQQGQYGRRGEQGLYESVSLKMFELAGAPTSNTSFVQLRIIDEPSEAGASQYTGDLWGLYLAIENYDESFKDNHGLPDGNLYDMQDGFGVLQAQGETLPSDSSDLSSYLNAQNNSPTDQWWRDNMDVQGYYSYRAVVEAVHHYDISDGKNYNYFHRPVDPADPLSGRWQVLPWDNDLTWGDHMFGSGDEPYKSRVLGRQTFNLEYRNRMREIRNLLYNADQTGALIDEMASFIYTPGQPSFVDVDRAMWDYNPTMVDGSKGVYNFQAGQGLYYNAAVAPGGFAGMAAQMKQYVLSRGSWIDANITADPNIPVKPAATYLGAPAHAADDLRFRPSAFAGRNGGTFAAIKWRLAEVSNAALPGIYPPGSPKKYEINAVWESPDITTPGGDVRVPSTAVQAGHNYRLRVKVKDNTGRWSDRSDAVQFVAGAPVVSVADALRVTELNYHPADPTPAETAAGFTDAESFEFIELTNVAAGPVDLGGLGFSAGIEYDFPANATLAAGQRTVLVSNAAAFAKRYPGVAIGGVYTNNLSNGGEQLAVKTPGSGDVFDFTYDDVWYPTTDGGGYALEIVNPNGAAPQWSLQAGWKAGSTLGGTPGTGPAVAPPVVSSVVVNTGQAQRSMVKQLTVGFDRDVVLDAGAITLVRPAAGSVPALSIPLTVAPASGVAATYTLAFPAPYNLSLPDGVYTLTVAGGKVHAGSAGGATMAADYAKRLHRLYGDDDGDGDLDAADLFQLRSTVNKPRADPAYKWWFDYDDSGTVDAADLFQLRSRTTTQFKNYG